MLRIPARDGSILEMTFESVDEPVVELRELKFVVRDDIFLEPKIFVDYRMSQSGSTVSLAKT